MNKMLTDDGLQESERRDVANVLNHRLHHPGCLTGARRRRGGGGGGKEASHIGNGNEMGEGC